MMIQARHVIRPWILAYRHRRPGHFHHVEKRKAADAVSYGLFMKTAFTSSAVLFLFVFALKF